MNDFFLADTGKKYSKKCGFCVKTCRYRQENAIFALFLMSKLADSMDYISVAEFAKRCGVAERTVRNYCSNGKIPGAVLVGKTWSVPCDAVLPQRGAAKRKLMPLLAVLKEQREARLKGGIYHRTQVDLTYNSNHIEGNRLTHEQTRFIFETNTVGVEGDTICVDDVI